MTDFFFFFLRPLDFFSAEMTLWEQLHLWVEVDWKQLSGAPLHASHVKYIFKHSWDKINIKRHIPLVTWG